MPRLLDILVASATKRINDDAYVEPTLPKPNARLRAMLTHRKQAKALIKRLDQALEARGLDTDDDGDLIVPYQLKRSQEAKWRRERDARLQRVRAIRDKALLDLIDMPPKVMKQYYVKLKKALETL